MPSSRPSLSVVIPCFQEVEALPSLAEALGAWLADRTGRADGDPGAVELIFVDDGSTDGTGAMLREVAAGLPEARVVTHESNRGVGAAMRSGFAASRGAVVVCYDADRTYPLADVDRLAGQLDDGWDVASASPFLAGAGLEGVPGWRRLLTRAAGLAYRLALGGRRDRVAAGVGTFSCAFRAYRGDLVRGLSFRADGFPAAAEILGTLILGGARVVEVPSVLSVRREGVSKMRVGRAARGHAVVLARLLRWRAPRSPGRGS